jgi:hypothetical protein
LLHARSFDVLLLEATDLEFHDGSREPGWLSTQVTQIPTITGKNLITKSKMDKIGAFSFNFNACLLSEEVPSLDGNPQNVPPSPLDDAVSINTNHRKRKENKQRHISNPEMLFCCVTV